jgi:hypothetical protein
VNVFDYSKKPVKSTSVSVGHYVLNEDHSECQNNFNTCFNFLAGSTQIFYNGTRVKLNVDYIEVYPNLINLKFSISLGDSLVIDYIKV